MSKKRRSYDREFKLRVVEKSYEVANIGHLAADLGIRPELIYRWRGEHNAHPEKSFPGNGKKAMTDLERENERLRKELADVQMEHAILKKAIAIFTKTDGRRSNS